MPLGCNAVTRDLNSLPMTDNLSDGPEQDSRILPRTDMRSSVSSRGVVAVIWLGINEYIYCPEPLKPPTRVVPTFPACQCTCVYPAINVFNTSPTPHLDAGYRYLCISLWAKNLSAFGKIDSACLHVLVGKRALSMCVTECL